MNGARFVILMNFEKKVSTKTLEKSKSTVTPIVIYSIKPQISGSQGANLLLFSQIHSAV